MKTEEIQARLERGYTMAIYGTRENIHEQMTNDIKELLEAINYTRCCKSDSEQFSFADMRDAFDYASVSSQRRDGYTFKEWISKR